MYCRAAARGLRRIPGFAAAIALTLALGLSVNATAFAVFSAVVLRPLPYPNSQRLVRIWESNVSDGRLRVGVSQSTYSYWKETAISFSALEFFTAGGGRSTVATIDEQTLVVSAASVSPGFFALFGVAPEVGNISPGIVLSDPFWRSRFGAKENVIGRGVVFEGSAAKSAQLVTGIMPSMFGPPAVADMWAIVPDIRSGGEPSRMRTLQVVGRLNPSVSLEIAAIELQRLSSNLERTFPHTHTGWRPEIVTLEDATTGPAKPAVVALYGISLVLLGICFLNLASLIGVRSVAWRRDSVIRLSLGANRTQVLLPTLSEVLLPAVIGSALGILATHWLLQVTAHLTLPLTPYPIDTFFDTPTRIALFVVSLGALLFATVMVGRAVPVSTTSGQLGFAMRGVTTGRPLWTPVVVQLALSVALTSLALCFASTLLKLFRVSPGVDTSHLLAVELRQPVLKDAHLVTHYPVLRFRRVALDFIGRLRQIEGAITVAGLSDCPFVARNATGFVARLDGPQSMSQEDNRRYPLDYPIPARVVIATDDAFDTLGISVTHGAGLDATSVSAPPLEDPSALLPPTEVVVSQSAAGALGGEHAVGHYIAVRGASHRSARIVGIANDVYFRGVQAGLEPTIYLPFGDEPIDNLTVFVKYAGPPDRIVSSIRELGREFGDYLGLGNMRHMTDLESAALARERTGAGVGITMAICAIFLTLVGVAGVVSRTVAHSRRDLAIRMALGASASSLMHDLLAKTLLAALGGIALGSVAGYQATRWLATYDRQISSIPGSALFTFLCLLTSIVFLVALVPVFRVRRIDPAQVLKEDAAL